MQSLNKANFLLVTSPPDSMGSSKCIMGSNVAIFEHIHDLPSQMQGNVLERGHLMAQSRAPTEHWQRTALEIDTVNMQESVLQEASRRYARREA